MIERLDAVALAHLGLTFSQTVAIGAAAILFQALVETVALCKSRKRADGRE